YPQLIGNADGVEAWARDRANRINLREEKLKTEKLVQHLEAAMRDRVRYTYPGDVHDPTLYQHDGGLSAKLSRAKMDLEAYNKIESALGNAVSLEAYQHGEKGDPISLLTLQNDGRRVKAAVAQGDVDHAKHVATFVPGIGTTVEGQLHNYLRQTENLRQAAATQGNMSTSDVATVAWLGYDAPGEAKLENLGDITSPKLAQAGSDRLAGFMTGMHASRQYGAGDAHMTLVGHSYGSTTSGMAATKVKSGIIDDLVLFGSPGMGTYNSNDYHVDEAHRWVSGVPKGDSVQGLGGILRRKIGRFGLGKNPMDADSGFTHLSDDATGYEGYDHNAPPSNPGNYALDTIGRLLTGRRPSLPSFTNHNIYLEQGTETLQDIARVVAGTKK
ncbi:alpha/beta hydrolase, partial [Trueperella pyogenes]|uniref:alpha/beta hydrolase n=1 Tax=Trueperella pyogenes TaxID=1661 RepID=UPI000660C3E6